MDSNIFIEAAKTTNLRKFLTLLLPKEWQPITARIIESGAEMSPNMVKWGLRWGKIPFTVKKGRTELEASVKSCLFRVHDCFHQLWGLPVPKDFSQDEYYLFKRVQMCGEVVVLTISEWMLCEYLYDNYEDIRPFIERRCSIQMMKGALKGKTPIELVMRMDEILHKNIKPKWVRDNEHALKFWEYYVPMLEDDRKGIDNNWNAMREENFRPSNIPNSRYSKDLEGLELSIWMMNDFLHLLKTDDVIDEGLAKFNRERRSKIVLPKNWI